MDLKGIISFPYLHPSLVNGREQKSRCLGKNSRPDAGMEGISFPPSLLSTAIATSISKFLDYDLWILTK